MSAAAAPPASSYDGMVTVVRMGRVRAWAGPNVPALREQRDRIRAGFINGLGREPGTLGVSALPGDDLPAVAAILVWEGTLPEHALRWVWHGQVGLDGKVTDGVVSTGTRAAPIDHLTDLTSVVAILGAVTIP